MSEKNVPAILGSPHTNGMTAAMKPDGKGGLCKCKE